MAVPPVTISGGLVLVVDDAPHVADATAALLRTVWGGEVVALSSSRRALQYCTIREPSLVIVDVCMPELSGVTLAFRLRTRYPGLPILFLTGSPRDPELAAARSVFEPAVRVLAKPARAEQLVAEVAATSERLN